MSLLLARTTRSISTKFCTDLHSISGKVLNTSMTRQPNPWTPGVPQTPKPKWVMGEKTLCHIKCPDGWRNVIKFFPGSAGPRLARIYIRQTVCTYVPLSRSNSCTNLNQIFYRPPHPLGKCSDYKLDPANQPPDSWVPQAPKPEEITGE